MPAATLTLDALEEKGWFLNEEGIASVKEQAGKDSMTLDEFIDVAKDMDLRELVDKGFRKGDSTKLSQLPSNVVLQVLQVQNIAVPTIQHVEKPRLLRVVFTDGSKKKWIGAEILGQMESINLQTPPGTKFLVTKPIEIREQLLILGPGMVKSLGGQVQEMIQAWKAGKQFIQRSKGKQSSSNDDMPPPFIPFKIKPAGRSTKDEGQPPPPPPLQQQPKGDIQGGDDRKERSTKSNKKGSTKEQRGKPQPTSGQHDTNSNGRKKTGSRKSSDRDPSDKKPKDKDNKKKAQGSVDKKTPDPVDKKTTQDPVGKKNPRSKGGDKKEQQKKSDKSDRPAKSVPQKKEPPVVTSPSNDIKPTILSATSKPFIPSGLTMGQQPPPQQPPSQQPTESGNTASPASSRGRGGNRGRGNRHRGASNRRRGGPDANQE
ncbi:hypothetical protein [Absidia glauca]|uniref:RecQ mediated genome instability protein 1 OB-fold domain-containing protein n=1 Tax=Absidia glauca TaxID=4829 RepID=A0A163MR65_ABSGL|nr:hypothetical protein [Absidia glauca]